MISRSDKVRFEIKDDKIRALYGHSSSFIPFTKIQKIASKPPHILYHGTSPSAVKNIMSEGLTYESPLRPSIYRQEYSITGGKA